MLLRSMLDIVNFIRTKFLDKMIFFNNANYIIRFSNHNSVHSALHRKNISYFSKNNLLIYVERT